MVRLVIAAVALLVVICHTSRYGTCDALSAPHSGSNGGAQQDSAAAGAPPPALLAGDTYRPPIINMPYGGGPILWKPIRLYFIWYGTWTDAQKKVIRTASNSLTPKDKSNQYPSLRNYWGVITEYYQELPGEGRKYGSNDVSIGGEIDDDYSFGQSIDMQNDPIKIIESHVGQGLPTDLEQGVYFLFSSADVGLTNNPNFCGYHDSQCFIPNSDCTNPLNHIVYSFVALAAPTCSVFGNALTGPPPNHLISPNGDLDSMIVTYLHELLELAVDPYPNVHVGWRGKLNDVQTEAADLCAYSFVAGDWWYCSLPSMYPDFTGSPCQSLYNHHKALTAPKTGTTFNVYGVGGSKFLVQQFWSLGNKGCVLQREQASCPASTIILDKRKGTIQRGLFFNGVGLQRYAAGGQSCTWKIAVAGAKRLYLTFDTLALGYDKLDFITLTRGNVVLKKLTGFGKNIKFTVNANAVKIHFFSDGGRSPYPSSAGFSMRYTAGF